MNIQKVGVLGCGLMGSGIAQVCATAGFEVIVLEVEQKYLDKGFAGIEKSLAKFAERPPEKGGITQQQKEETLAAQRRDAKRRPRRLRHRDRGCDRERRAEKRNLWRARRDRKEGHHLRIE